MTRSASPSRVAAFDALLRVEADRAYASPLLASLQDSDLALADRALANEIVLGVLRWRLTLDYFAERYSQRSLERMDLPVLIALRMGIYQIRHLTRIPHSAAVDESVKLVKRAGLTSAAGLVNAVLRNAVRNADDVAGAGIEDPLERASIEVSHPAWMLERWQRQFGANEATLLAMANNHAGRAAFRVNTLRASTDEALAALDAEGVKVAASKWVPGAFVVESGAPIAASAAARSGLVYLQDEASQLISRLVAPTPGERILDLCAAPGSKATHIAALAGDRCWVVACDLHPHRLGTLVNACKRLGVRAVEAVAADATLGIPVVDSARPFDRALVDAPCTGTGTLRQNPEIKWRLSPQDISRLSDLQFELLVTAADSIRGGGRLVYSTCSLEPEENEGVIGRFLARDGRFRVARPDAAASLITDEGFVRTFPHRHGMDGFFAAVLESVVDDEEPRRDTSGHEGKTLPTRDSS